jgi:uncharacterized protein YjbI with pentapeptide repeats
MGGCGKLARGKGCDEWRKKNPAAYINLSRANLTYANLSGENLAKSLGSVRRLTSELRGT